MVLRGAHRGRKTRVPQRQDIETHLRQGIPPLPEVRVGDDADSFTELALDGWGAGDHQADELLFDRRDLLERQLVDPIFVLFVCQQG